MSKLIHGVYTALAQMNRVKNSRGANGSIRVYPAELHAGLGSSVASGGAIAYLGGIDSLVSKEGGGCVAAKSDDSLFAFSSVMVSTGKNGNDDVFLPEEVWAARHSPEDKPLNLEHDPTHIIGHITGQHVADMDLQTITSDTNLPAKFNLVAEGVLYRHHAGRNKSLSIEADTLIDEVKNKQWAVSMECLFNSFDYMVGDKIVERMESTAFLTKHLRVHGGRGSFNGQAVGRVLRDVQFSALGIVKTPANPESRFL